MQLPNAAEAAIDREKIVDYLLSPTHRVGASKARFFTAFGFRQEEWTVFLIALRRHAIEHPVARTSASAFGVRHEVDGPLTTPDGRSPMIRTVWQLDHGQLAPRLITAHPL